MRHVAGIVEDTWNTAVGGLLARRGWRPLAVGHVGYGGADFVRVLARVVHAPAPEPDAPVAEELAEQAAYRRGWRNFLTAEAVGAPVAVELGDEVHEARTDRSGNLDVRLPNPGWSPGWHRGVVTPVGGDPVSVRIRVVDDAVGFGLVSDIDDTVIRTWLPRPLIAAWNTFVLQEHARRPVPGMADLYDEVLRDRPGAPVFYVSTGAWNTAGTLRRFLERHGFPDGPLLLTDWGPTNTGWFRSGQEHKAACLRSLVEDFPTVRWLLVGDDGQHDPVIYGEHAREHPDRVLAIAIRQLEPSEQVLSHFTPVSKLGSERSSSPPAVPEVRGQDGHELARRLVPLLG